jgi:23S rRNA pseudouridine2605 synthase
VTAPVLKLAVRDTNIVVAGPLTIFRGSSKDHRGVGRVIESRSLLMGFRSKPRVSWDHETGRPGAGLARALSKLGLCSRARAMALIREGRVRVDGMVCREPGAPVDLDRDRIEVDGRRIDPAAKIYLMLNKPRGVVTTASDEKGRKTVYACLTNNDLPWLAPVGRLDKASEGLLLFTNDTRWASRILAPDAHVDKTYHVQVACLPDASLLRRLAAGIATDQGDCLAAKEVRFLRHGRRNCWLEVVLDEGKNRHLRRLVDGLGVRVLRLVRVGIGPLQLGNLAKGEWRHLTKNEVRMLAEARDGGAGPLLRRS